MSEITDKAQQLLAGRLDSVARLEDRSNHLRSAREQVTAAERELVTAWAAAVGAGWTARELKQLGFEQPASRRGGRPKSPRSPSKSGQ